MSSRLSIIFYIVLCFEIGIVLTVLPWVPHGWWGLSDWGNNYFLWLAAHKTGSGLQRVVASGWVRGAVSGIGIVNLAMGVWEIIHFRQTARALDSGSPTGETSARKSRERTTIDDAQPVKTDPLSDYPRRNR